MSALVDELPSATKHVRLECRGVPCAEGTGHPSHCSPRTLGQRKRGAKLDVAVGCARGEDLRPTAEKDHSARTRGSRNQSRPERRVRRGHDRRWRDQFGRGDRPSRPRFPWAPVAPRGPVGPGSPAPVAPRGPAGPELGVLARAPSPSPIPASPRAALSATPTVKSFPRRLFLVTPDVLTASFSLWNADSLSNDILHLFYLRICMHLTPRCVTVRKWFRVAECPLGRSHPGDNRSRRHPGGRLVAVRGGRSPASRWYQPR